jgi:hypothetical protein
MRLPDYVVHRVPSSESLRNISAYGVGASPQMDNQTVVSWETAHRQIILKVKQANPTWSDKQCENSLGNYSEKTSWELTQFNQYFKQVTEIIPKIKNRFEPSVLAVVESNEIMSMSENSNDLILWLTELKCICSSSSGHAVSSLEEAKYKLRGLKMMNENYEDYVGRFVDVANIIKSSSENKINLEKEFIETFLAGLNDKFVTGWATPLLEQYLSNEKNSKIYSCKDLKDIILFVKGYIQEVTKPARKLRAVNLDNYSKESIKIETEKKRDVSKKNTESNKDSLVLTQVLTTLKALQTDHKKSKEHYKQSNKNSVNSNFSKTKSNEINSTNSNGTLKRKRISEDVSDLSSTNESVCLVHLVTGKCNRAGCNLRHLDEHKKKMYLTQWSSDNSTKGK